LTVPVETASSTEARVHLSQVDWGEGTYYTGQETEAEDSFRW